MFCPNCGANNDTKQKFCRACGLNLQKSAESLLEQFPDAEKNTLQRQERLLEKFGNVAFGGFGMVFLGGVGAMIYVIVTKFIIPGPANNVLAGIFLIAFLLFAILALAYVVFNEILKEKKQKINPHIQNELSGGKDTGKLLDEGNLQPVSSVTDHTTELLYDKSRTKKLD